MINSSILTTLYSQLGFQSHAISELFDSDSEAVQKRGLSILRTDSVATVENFLPPFVLATNSGAKARIFVDLEFEEVNLNDRKRWSNILSKATSTASSGVKMGTQSEGFAFVLFEREDDDVWVPADINLAATGSLDEGAYRFLIYIAVKKIDNIPAIPTDDMYERTELVACELICGYRRLIRAVQFLIGDSYYPGVAGGKASASDLHSTEEDAYRMICNFKDVERSVWEYFHQELGIRVNSLADFLELRTGGGHRYISKLCEKWAHGRRVRQGVVRKKLFEYFIYRSL